MDGRWSAFEIKLGSGQVEGGAASLKKFARRIDTDRCGAPVVLGVIVGTGYGYVRETVPHRPYVLLPHRVQSRWWSGSADVRTFKAEEILATKLRALYSRRKGRDLYDLWLALTALELDEQLVVDGLAHYMGARLYSYRQLHGNLLDKLATPEFLDDIRNLTLDLHGYEHRPAAELLMRRLGTRLRNAPTETVALHFPEQA